VELGREQAAGELHEAVELLRDQLDTLLEDLDT
jgi:hypothetical protein